MRNIVSLSLDGTLGQDALLSRPLWPESGDLPFVGIPCGLPCDPAGGDPWIPLGYDDGQGAGTFLFGPTGMVSDDFFGDNTPHGCLPLLVYTPPPLPAQSAFIGMLASNVNTRETPDPVNTRTGNYRYQRVDLALPGRGPAPRFVRAYNSLDDRVGPLRTGWTHNYAVRLRAPGDGTEDVDFMRESSQTDRYTKNPDGSYSPPAAMQATLVRHPDSSYTATLVDRTVLTFNAGGDLTSIRDRSGNEATLSYNAAAQLTAVADPAGRGAPAFTYHPTSGRLTAVSDWAGRRVAYGYDAAGRLETVTDRESKVTTFAYDGASQHLVSITDANAHVAVTMTYDSAGRVATQKDARGLLTGQATSFSYVTNPAGTQTTTVTYPTTSHEPTWNAVEIDTYDARGWIVEHVAKPTSSAADDITEQCTYDANGFRDGVTDGRGNTTTFCYDVAYSGAAIAGSRGLLTRVISPAPDGATNPLVTLYQRAHLEHRVRFVYAPAPVAGGSQLTTEFRYDVVGNRTVVIDANGQVTRYLHDERDRLATVQQSPSVRTNPAVTPSPLYETAYQYDHVGNLARVLRASGDAAYERAVNYAYDSVHRLRTETQYPSWPTITPTLITTRAYDKTSNRTSAAAAGAGGREP